MFHKWNVRDPNGTATTIDSGSLTNNSQTTSTTFTPILREYMIFTRNCASATNIESRIIDVVSPLLSTVQLKPHTILRFELLQQLTMAKLLSLPLVELEQ
jgi:hypothetical protein